MKRYFGIAALTAAAVFLAAPLLVRRPVPPPLPVAWDERADYENYRRPSHVDVQWRESRGHAFSLKDRDETGASKQRPVPGGCLECHAAGGAPGTGSYYELRAQARPIGCQDCHERGSAGLRLTRPAMLAGRTGDLRVMVCAQCHGTYYFENGRVMRPWSRGLRVEDIEQHFGAEPGAIRHPQYELWSQGVHSAAGVACTDCHMPRVRRGGMRVTNHRAARPLDGQPCLACHQTSAAEMRARMERIQHRTEALAARAAAAVTALEAELRTPAAPSHALALHRKARLRLDFVRADGSRGFHAPQEALRVLAEAIDYARQGQIAAARAK